MATGVVTKLRVRSRCTVGKSVDALLDGELWGGDAAKLRRWGADGEAMVKRWVSGDHRDTRTGNRAKAGCVGWPTKLTGSSR